MPWIFSEEAQEVVYIYERSDAAQWIQKYQDSEGNQLASTILSGKSDCHMPVKQRNPWLESVVDIPDNASGIFSNSAEVVYVYERSDAHQRLWNTKIVKEITIRANDL